MTAIQKRVMQGFYRAADGDPAALPWHSEEPPPLLVRAIERRRAGSAGALRALDVGCGSGVFAAFMASRGVDVTAVDYLPQAIAMARETARTRDVAFDLIEADVLEYEPRQPFDVVLDSGCLHNFGGAALRAYPRRLSRWLAPGGDFVLAHWGKRHTFDWRPIGPRRRTPASLAALLGPELELVNTSVADERVPFPFGPWVRMACYRFTRSGPQHSDKVRAPGSG